MDRPKFNLKVSKEKAVSLFFCAVLVSVVFVWPLMDYFINPPEGVGKVVLSHKNFKWTSTGAEFTLVNYGNISARVRQIGVGESVSNVTTIWEGNVVVSPGSESTFNVSFSPEYDTFYYFGIAGSKEIYYAFTVQSPSSPPPEIEKQSVSWGYSDITFVLKNKGVVAVSLSTSEIGQNGVFTSYTSSTVCPTIEAGNTSALTISNFSYDSFVNYTFRFVFEYGAENTTSVTFGETSPQAPLRPTLSVETVNWNLDGAHFSVVLHASVTSLTVFSLQINYLNVTGYTLDLPLTMNVGDTRTVTVAYNYQYGVSYMFMVGYGNDKEQRTLTFSRSSPAPPTVSIVSGSFVWSESGVAFDVKCLGGKTRVSAVSINGVDYTEKSNLTITIYDQEVKTITISDFEYNYSTAYTFKIEQDYGENSTEAYSPSAPTFTLESVEWKADNEATLHINNTSPYLIKVSAVSVNGSDYYSPDLPLTIDPNTRGNITLEYFYWEYTTAYLFEITASRYSRSFPVNSPGSPHIEITSYVWTEQELQIKVKYEEGVKPIIIEYLIVNGSQYAQYVSMNPGDEVWLTLSFEYEYSATYIVTVTGTSCDRTVTINSPPPPNVGLANVGWGDGTIIVTLQNNDNMSRTVVLMWINGESIYFSGSTFQIGPGENATYTADYFWVANTSYTLTVLVSRYNLNYSITSPKTTGFSNMASVLHGNYLQGVTLAAFLAGEISYRRRERKC